MKEEWRAVPGYEGLYEVSNMGRVRSLDREVKRIKCSSFVQSGKVLKPCTGTNGYKEVALSKNGNSRTLRVHRIVALSFIPNPNNLPFVNHKDECKTNNCVNNLEWCTAMYNSHYGSGENRIKLKRRAVVQYSFSGEVIREYDSIYNASKETGVYASKIVVCCKGMYGKRSAGGYKWKYKTD